MAQCPDAPFTIRELVAQWDEEDAAIAREAKRIVEAERGGEYRGHFRMDATAEQRRRGGSLGGQTTAARTAPTRRNTSGIVGVSRQPNSSTWRAKFRGKQIGSFATKEEAAEAVRLAREAVAA